MNGNEEPDDLSFVVLGPGSMPSYMTSQQHPYGDISGSHHLLSMEATGVQMRLDQLIKENDTLRETLNTTNTTMKTQFDTLAQWQQDVLAAHANHKDKFAETRELVLKLKAENAALKKVAENNMSSFSSIGSTQLNAMISKLTLDNEKLNSDKSILVKERDAFREECTRLTHKIIDLENVVRKKSEEVHILHGNYESLAYSAESIPSYPYSGTVVKNSKDWSLMADMTTKNQLENQLRSASGQLQQLTQLYEAEQMKSENERQTLSEERQKFEKKCTFYENTILNLREDLESAHEACNTTNEELQKKQILLDTALAELKKERETKDENDEVIVLKTQVEVYQNDYKEERTAREKLVEEKENLAEELRLLKAKVMRLEGTATTDPSAPELVSAPPVIPPEENPAVGDNPRDEVLFKCPLCLSKFTDANDCHRHANYCLDTYALP